MRIFGAARDTGLSVVVSVFRDCAHTDVRDRLSDLEGVFRKHNLERQTHFGQTFVGAKWDDSRKLYIIDFHETHDKSKTCRVEAEILVSAIGGFSTPAEKPLGLEGVEHYQGTCFHSARWDYGVDLKNKRVAVIGNGPSAGEFQRLWLEAVRS